MKGSDSSVTSRTGSEMWSRHSSRSNVSSSRVARRRRTVPLSPIAGKALREREELSEPAQHRRSVSLLHSQSGGSSSKGNDCVFGGCAKDAADYANGSSGRTRSRESRGSDVSSVKDILWSALLACNSTPKRPNKRQGERRRHSSMASVAADYLECSPEDGDGDSSSRSRRLDVEQLQSVFTNCAASKITGGNNHHHAGLLHASQPPRPPQPPPQAPPQAPSHSRKPSLVASSISSNTSPSTCESARIDCDYDSPLSLADILMLSEEERPHHFMLKVCSRRATVDEKTRSAQALVAICQDVEAAR